MDDPIRYTYRFKFQGGKKKTFTVSLDRQTLDFIPQHQPSKPTWAKLHCHQCEHCPLQSDVEYCPVAVNLTHIVEEFKGKTSIENALVIIKKKERQYQHRVPLPRGLGSLMGAVMMTSNCPVLDHARPLVRFHLPFATGPETVYQTLSMYLLDQYLIMKKGGKPDWQLEQLAAANKDIIKVLTKMRERLQDVSHEKNDILVNALVYLASLRQQVQHVLELQDLPELENAISRLSQQIS